MNNVSKLVFLDLWAWHHSTGGTEMSDLAFNGGEGGAVHLKQRPLQCHSFVNMACINNVAASLKASVILLDGHMGGWGCVCFHINIWRLHEKKSDTCTWAEKFLIKHFVACNKSLLWFSNFFRLHLLQNMNYLKIQVEFKLLSDERWTPNIWNFPEGLYVRMQMSKWGAPKMLVKWSLTR